MILCALKTTISMVLTMILHLVPRFSNNDFVHTKNNDFHDSNNDFTSCSNGFVTMVSKIVASNADIVASNDFKSLLTMITDVKKSSHRRFP